jgi:hypothetical protein
MFLSAIIKFVIFNVFILFSIKINKWYFLWKIIDCK